MDAAAIYGACIVVVEDDPDNIRVLRGMLNVSGYSEVHSCYDAGHLLELCRVLKPDLLLLDLNLESRSGLGLLAEVRQEIGGPETLPVIVISGDRRLYACHQSLRLGANDFISKPFDELEIQLRISNALRLQVLHQRVKLANEVLEERVRERTEELIDAQIQFLGRLAAAAELRDDVTGRHTARVGATSALIAQVMGLAEDEVDAIRHAAPLHDVGKLAVPESILRKPDRLTAEEYNIMKCHTVVGSRILETENPHSSWPIMRAAEEIARSHHEHWDGAGYPRRLRGTNIPLCGRIVAVADVYDALTHQRPYKEAWPEDLSLRKIEDLSGTQFDPAVVLAFRRIATDGSLQHAINATA